MSFAPFYWKTVVIQNRRMSKEIERKFLVGELPFNREEHPSVYIEQGYLALEPGGQEVRIRKKDDAYKMHFLLGKNHLQILGDT